MVKHHALVGRLLARASRLWRLADRASQRIAAVAAQPAADEAA